MTDRRWQDIWMEQCEAAEAILHRYGVEPAFDYIVGEKLVNFVEAAAENPAFALALPRFVSRVCCKSKGRGMTDILFVVAPWRGQGLATVTRDVWKAAGTALVWDEGCRVVVVNTTTDKWLEVEAPHPVSSKDEAHARRLQGGLVTELEKAVVALANGCPPLPG